MKTNKKQIRKDKFNMYNWMHKHKKKVVGVLAIIITVSMVLGTLSSVFYAL